MKISVAMAAYNGERFIEEQLQSILDQDHAVDEIVVVDDNSSDTTRNLVVTLMQKHPQLQLITHERNMGTNRSFEDAIRACSGDVIFIADKDDIWMPHKVSRMLSEHERNPRGLLCSDAIVFSSTGEISASELHFHGHQRPYVNPVALTITSCYPGHNMMLTKEFVSDALPFPEVTLYDHWLAVRAALRNQLGYLPEPLVRHRIHDANQVHGKRKKRGKSEAKRVKRQRARAALEEIFKDVRSNTSQDSLAHRFSSRFLERNVVNTLFNLSVFMLALKNRQLIFPGLSLSKSLRKAHNLAR